MTQLIAERPVFYAGRTRRKGEVFAATAAHAAILLRTRQVKVHAADDPVEPTRVKRQYRRRDMRAQVQE
jgi:hypothetical protein